MCYRADGEVGKSGDGEERYLGFAAKQLERGLLQKLKRKTWNNIGATGRLSVQLQDLNPTEPLWEVSDGILHHHHHQNTN